MCVCKQSEEKYSRYSMDERIKKMEGSTDSGMTPLLLIGAGVLAFWFITRNQQEQQPQKPKQDDSSVPTEGMSGTPLNAQTNYLPDKNPMADVSLMNRTGLNRAVRGYGTRDTRGEPDAMINQKVVAPVFLQNPRVVEAAIDKDEVDGIRRPRKIHF